MAAAGENKLPCRRESGIVPCMKITPLQSSKAVGYPVRALALAAAAAALSSCEQQVVGSEPNQAAEPTPPPQKLPGKYLAKGDTPAKQEPRQAPKPQPLPGARAVPGESSVREPELPPQPLPGEPPEPSPKAPEGSNAIPPDEVPQALGGDVPMLIKEKE